MNKNIHFWTIVVRVIVAVAAGWATAGLATAGLATAGLATAGLASSGAAAAQGEPLPLLTLYYSGGLGGNVSACG